MVRFKHSWLQRGRQASGYYEIVSSLFPQVTIKLEGVTSSVSTISLDNVSDGNVYIQLTMLNGKPLAEPRYPQKDMIAGGSIVFGMSATPNYKWGIANRTVGETNNN